MHSPVGYAIESGMLTETDALDDDERHIVSNMVGSRTMHIEVGPSQRLAARDTVIVASDGLYDNLHLDEIIRDGCSGKLKKRIERRAQLTASRMTGEDSDHPSKPDDLTILIYTA